MNAYTRLRSVYGEQCMSRAQVLNGIQRWIQRFTSSIQPTLSAFGYHLYGKLKEHLRGNHYAIVDDVSRGVQTWIKQTPAAFLEKDIVDLVSRWQKCIASEGEYVEQQELTTRVIINGLSGNCFAAQCVCHERQSLRFSLSNYLILRKSDYNKNFPCKSQYTILYLCRVS